MDFDWTESNEAMFSIWRHPHKYFHMEAMCLFLIMLNYIIEMIWKRKTAALPGQISQQPYAH